MSAAPDQPPDGEAPPKWYNAPFRFTRYALGLIPKVLELALKNRATFPQIVVLALVLIAIAGLVISTFLALLRDVEYLFVTFAVLVGAYFLLVLQAALFMRARRPPPAGDPAELAALLEAARREAAAAAADRARLSGELAAETGRHREAAARLQAQAQLRAIYEDGTDLIVGHYLSRPDRWPCVLDHLTVITIAPDGTAEISERRKVRAAVGRPQHFLVERFIGTRAVGSFLDLGFQLHVHGPAGQQVAYLPGAAKAGTYDVLLVFLPPLETAGSVAAAIPLDFTVSCRWPGAYSDLIDPARRKDYYALTVRTVTSATVPLVRFVFQIHESIRDIRLSKRAGVSGEEMRDAPPEFLRPGYRTYLWQARDVPDQGQVAVWLDRT